jgi:SAM-dependent methyltransferase
VLGDESPDWRTKRIHECSPEGPASRKLHRECPRYVESQLFSGVPLGTAVDGVRCEDLERQTFSDGSFDIVVTQDVFEHVFDPAAAFSEIARTLAPGGAHIFTVPWYYWKPTLRRAHLEAGAVVHDEPPEYHGNPVDPNGSLVVTEWGWDLCNFIDSVSPVRTKVVKIYDPAQGIVGDFLEVFVSVKTG